MPTVRQRIRRSLAGAFEVWGKNAVKRIMRLTQRHGVICSSSVYSDGKAG